MAASGARPHWHIASFNNTCFSQDPLMKTTTTTSTTIVVIIIIGGGCDIICLFGDPLMETHLAEGVATRTDPHWRLETLPTDGTLELVLSCGRVHERGGQTGRGGEVVELSSCEPRL